MSRSKSFLNGVMVFYLFQACLMLVGLWLTPFYLRIMGASDYGVWLIAMQVLSFLLIADLGIIAVLPRDIGLAHGRELSEPGSENLRLLIGQTAKIILLQTGVIAAIAVGLFVFKFHGNSSLRGPLGLVLSVFVLTYPLRIFPAVLGGLQDLKFIGQMRAWLWAVATALTVVLLYAGMRFYALAWGWCLQEIAGNLIGLWRLRRLRPDLVRLETWTMAGPTRLRWFQRGLWVSMNCLAVWLASSIDLLIVARVFGPAIVVVYSCTVKLVTVLQNQPQMLASSAVPGLSQMKTSESNERITQATSCLTQGMLLVAGAVFCVVVALNHHFVNLWVGSRFFGGEALTVFVLVNFLARLIDYTLAISLFALGHERLVAIRAMVDGVISASLAFILIWPLGLAGVSIGFACGAVFVAIPMDVWLLSRELKMSVLDVTRPYAPYLWRTGLVGLASFAILQNVQIPNLVVLCAAALAVGLGYLLVMFPYVRKNTLGEYIRAALASFQFPVWGRAFSRSNN